MSESININEDVFHDPPGSITSTITSTDNVINDYETYKKLFAQGLVSFNCHETTTSGPGA